MTGRTDGSVSDLVVQAVLNGPSNNKYVSKQMYKTIINIKDLSRQPSHLFWSLFDLLEKVKLSVGVL